MGIIDFIISVLVMSFVIYVISSFFKLHGSDSIFGGRIIRNTQCPECGSKNYIPIIYGYPGEELLRKGEAGEAKLGGCCVGIGDPDSYCKDCGYTWENW